MVLCDEVESSSLHEQLLAFEFLRLHVLVEAMLLARVRHSIGALACSSAHNGPSLYPKR